MSFTSNNYLDELERIKSTVMTTDDPIRILKLLSDKIKKESNPLQKEEFLNDENLVKQYNDYEYYLFCFSSNQERIYHVQKLIEIRHKIFFADFDEKEIDTIRENIMLEKQDRKIIRKQYSIFWEGEEDTLKILLDELEDKDLCDFKDAKEDFKFSLLGSSRYPFTKAKWMEGLNSLAYLLSELKTRDLVSYSDNREETKGYAVAKYFKMKEKKKDSDEIKPNSYNRMKTGEDHPIPEDTQRTIDSILEKVFMSD